VSNLARQEPAPALDEPHERLQWARRRAGIEDATTAAKRHGWRVSTYLSHENGTRGIKKMANEYARAYRVTAAWLMHGQEAAPVDPELVTLWTNLSEDDKQTVKRMMRGLARSAA
jgi:hypothetical protein